jgi:RNA polymerase sigma-70 factor (ECF subfamily)
MDNNVLEIELRQRPSADQAFGNDPAAILETRFDQLYAHVYGYLLNRVFDRELAEECAAETFYKAASSIHQVQAEVEAIRIWLLKISTNVLNTHYRKARLRRILLGNMVRETKASFDTSAMDSAKDERIDLIRSVIKKLSPKYQSVVVLRYYAQMSFEQIGEIIGCREKTARVRLSRALKEIRRRLDT